MEQPRVEQLRTCPPCKRTASGCTRCVSASFVEGRKGWSGLGFQRPGAVQWQRWDLLCGLSDLRYIIKSVHSFSLWPRWPWGLRPRLTGAERGSRWSTAQPRGAAAAQSARLHIAPRQEALNATHLSTFCAYGRHILLYL